MYKLQYDIFAQPWSRYLHYCTIILQIIRTLCSWSVSVALWSLIIIINSNIMISNLINISSSTSVLCYMLHHSLPSNRDRFVCVCYCPQKSGSSDREKYFLGIESKDMIFVHVVPFCYQILFLCKRHLVFGHNLMKALCLWLKCPNIP